MKLTITQITILREATREAVHAYTAKAEASKEAQPSLESYWLNEAEEARQLVHILNDALCIEVESASLEPATPAPTAEMVELATQILNQELDTPAPALPEPQAAPCATNDPTAGKYAHLWGGPEAPLKPTAESPADTSPAAKPAQAMHPAAPDAATNPSSGHAPEPPACTPAASLHSGAKAPSTPMSIHAVDSPLADSPATCGAAILPSDSSAHTGEACGDINCDGQCQPAAAPDLRPELVRVIDASLTVNAARITTSQASAAALRAAARFLRTDMHSLPAVITRRVRERLVKTAA